MFRTIVVPLDGSPLAEQALPFAERLAASTSAQLVLARAEGTENGARAYLEGIESQLTALGLSVQPVVEKGDPATAIIERARTSGADLIIMSTHGRSGPGRWLYGSVADEVLRHAPVPILLVPAIATQPWPPDRAPTVLVPLDGSKLAEAALAPAQVLAQHLGSEVILLEVVPPPPVSAYGDGSFVAAFDPREELALDEDYLSKIAARLKPDVRQVRIRTDVGPPATIIADTASREHADLIVMATHGRSGLARVVVGSVATGTLHRARIPLLLVGPAALQSTTVRQLTAATA